MSSLIGSLQNGITSGMEQVNAMTLNESTSSVSPGYQAQDMTSSESSQCRQDNGLTRQDIGLTRQDNGLTVQPSATLNQPVNVTSGPATDKLKPTKFISKLQEYPLHKSMSLKGSTRSQNYPLNKSMSLKGSSVPQDNLDNTSQSIKGSYVPQDFPENKHLSLNRLSQSSAYPENKSLSLKGLSRRSDFLDNKSLSLNESSRPVYPQNKSQSLRGSSRPVYPQNKSQSLKGSTRPPDHPLNKSLALIGSPNYPRNKSVPLKGLYTKHHLDPIPGSPHLKRIVPLTDENSRENPDSTINNLENNAPEKDAQGRTAESLIDAPLANLGNNDLPQQTFVLRKLNSPESLLTDDLYKRFSLSDNFRKLAAVPKQGDTTSSQLLNNSFPKNLGTDWNQAHSTMNSLLPPRDLGSIKSRSESALHTLSPPDQKLDPRRNSSQINLVPAESLISSNPRRDSAWTAEVLSIEIQVDYVMDPEELWGQTKPPVQEYQDNVQTVFLNLNSMTPPAMDALDNEQKTQPTDEVGIVIPVVTETPGDDERDDDDRKSDENSVENGVPPEKVESTKDPHRSRTSIDLNLPPREHWENRFQFLLSTIGYAVDLSNVWRFPFLCYKNGGGAFLIPYFTTLIFGAMPVFFMEMCLGQFHRCGPTAIWEKMSPMFKGIGMASCFMAYIVGFYYNVIIAWSFFYLFASFTSKLPWTSCFNSFNSENCWQIDWDTNTTGSSQPHTEAVGAAAVPKGSGSTRPFNRTYNVSKSVSATIEYFERGMLELHHSSGVDDLGGVKWQLALCTLLTFTLLYFCLWKGVKSTGKVVYVTATLPYIIMTILLIRGVLLPGAGGGIRYFITPKIESLQRPKVWIDAAVQIFFSIGSGFGTHIAYASYNKFHNNCKRDCMVTVAVNSFTSLFSGFVIFSYLGYMSLKTQKDIDKVATEGPGLVFIVYPEAIATLPGSVFWAIIFFFMLLALGLDSAFGGLESPLTGIRDEFSHLIKHPYFREILTLIIIVSAFLFSIPCVLQGGVYVFTILDTFAAGTSIVFIVLCEVVAVSWFYGMPEFCADVEKMIGEKPSMFWRICWKFFCPFLLTLIVASSIISYQPLTYRSSQGIYTYPSYANVIGWCIACSSMFMVPGYIIYRILRNKGSWSQRLALAMSPQCEHDEIVQKQVVKRFQKQHWISI